MHVSLCPLSVKVPLSSPLSHFLKSARLSSIPLGPADNCRRLINHVDMATANTGFVLL